MLLENSLGRLEHALQPLLPPELACACLPVPESVQFQFEEERARMAHASDYRRREYWAGRECLRHALGRLGLPPAPILTDDDDLPVLPEGVRGSITHSKGHCAAVAGRNDFFQALGVDLERTDRLSPSAIRKTVHPLEAQFANEDQQRATLLFSAKEAFYKLQFPVWHTYANFQDLALAVEDTGGILELKVLEISERFPEDLRFLAPMLRFRCRFVDNFVISVCWLDADPG